MAEKVSIELEAKTSSAEDAINDLRDVIQELTQAVEDNTESTAEGLENVEKASKQTQKGIKGIATSLKAAGIGLLIAAFATLKETFKENQVIVDLFSTAFQSFSIVLNDFVNFIINNFSAVQSFFKSIFENPKQSLLDFADAFKRNIQERFESYLDTLGFLASAVKKVFSGDFKGALEDVKNAGKESLDVFTGVNNTFDKGTKIAQQVSKSTLEYGKSVLKTAKSNVELANAAELATARNQGLKESFDLQAETLRQVRDEERNTIEDRIEANNKLGAVLDKQEELQRKEAQTAIDAAKTKLALDENNIQFQKELIEAQNELAAVEATIAGFRSEQKANDLALDREKRELQQSIIDGETERAINEKTFTAEQIENEVLRLQKLQEVASEEKQIEEQRLTEKRDSFKKGTQAFQDAQNELLSFQQENNQKQVLLEKQLNEAKFKQTTQALGQIAGIVGQNSKFGKGIAVVQAIRDTFAGANKALAQGGIFGFIQAAAIISAGIANVKAITSTKEPTPPSFARNTATNNISIPQATVQPPAFNIVGAGGTNQLAEAITGQQQQPVRAFVVSQDVTTAQSLERNIIDGASLG